MPKPKPVDIQALPELLRMLQSTRDTAQAAIKLGEAVQVSVDAVLEDGRQQVQAHLARKELRPKLTYKPLGDHRHVIVLGDIRYYLEPRNGFETLDDDEPKFNWWVEGGAPHNAISLFQGLIGILQHFCNPHEVVTGSNISPVDNLTT